MFGLAAKHAGVVCCFCPGGGGFCPAWVTLLDLQWGANCCHAICVVLCSTWDNSGDTTEPHKLNISVSSNNLQPGLRSGVFSINIRQEGIILNWQVLKTIPQRVITYFNFYLWETLYSGQSLTAWHQFSGLWLITKHHSARQLTCPLFPPPDSKHCGLKITNQNTFIFFY